MTFLENFGYVDDPLSAAELYFGLLQVSVMELFWVLVSCDTFTDLL